MHPSSSSTRFAGGELFDHILAHRYLKEKDASKLFAQLISGVTYLHNKKIVHRDLKLENLLLDRNRNIIITDFGFANRFEDRSNDLMATSCGSPCYAAPELVVQDGRYVGSQVDVWSCGVILYAMLAGYLPFDDDPSNPDGDNINLLYKYIINTPLSFPEWISDQPKDLLLRMLVPDPLKRCALSDVIRHPWLAKYAHLFERSLEELEAISEDNEQQKRMALQQQRQSMAARSAASAGDSMGRSQSSAQASGISGKARAHQSAMVVPTTSSVVSDDFGNGQSAGAYHQQRQQAAAAGTGGAVTHLHSANQPTGIPVPKNRRGHQAQSAIVVPTTASTRQNKENEALLGMEDVHGVLAAEHKKASELVGHVEDPTLPGSASTGKKRKVVNSPNGSGIPAPTNQQRYTVQVEYSGAPVTERKDDARAKGKGVERVEDEPMLDGTVSGSAEEDTMHTPKPASQRAMDTMPSTPTGREPIDPQTTPQPSRTRRPSAAVANPTPVINVTHPTGRRQSHPAEERFPTTPLPFPSPSATSRTNNAM